MVNYYAYYSFGGYKEFYLGNTKDSFSHSWYFSMLPIWETRYSASGDEALKTKIEDAKSLPQIEDVGKGGDNSSRIHRLPKGVDIKNQKKILNK